jgi:hypothetical protein
MKRGRDGYYYQIDKTSCGPIAIINAINDVEGTIDPIKHTLQRIKKKCKTTNLCGTSIQNFERTLKKYVKCKIIKSKSLRIINQSLKKGKSLVFIYPFNNNNPIGHFVFINEKYKMINSGIDSNWNKLYNKLLKNTNTKLKPIGWILCKKEKENLT